MQTTPTVTGAPSADVWTPSDPLGEALHFLRMTGVVYTRSELSAPWGVDLPAMPDLLMFHVVTDGHCLLEVEGEATRTLTPGAFTLVPHGEGHVLRSAANVPAPDLFDLPREQISERYEVLRHGGGGERTRLLCGAVRFEHPAARDLVRLLPRVLHIDAWHPAQSEWMQSTLRLMAIESAERRPGGETVVTRLADILVIQAIRTWIAEDAAARQGWLGALHDEQIGPAIVRIHREPERSWSVRSLAEAVAMSRSAFSAHFSRLVGEPPMQYLTRHRMHVAEMQLRAGDASVAEIAYRFGYQSEAAFRRAFKRVLGVAPGAARRQAAAG